MQLRRVRKIMGFLDKFRKKKEEPAKEEPKKCRNCNKELEDREGEFCSKECEDLYYDLHKS